MRITLVCQNVLHGMARLYVSVLDDGLVEP